MFLPFLILFFLANSLFGQINVELTKADKASYKLFQEKKWDELIAFSKESRDNDIDFYYLSYRVGIAYFNKENYYLSIWNFEKALSQNIYAKNDKVLISYLYDSYLFTNNITQAAEIVDLLNRDGVEVANPQKIVSSASIESGYSFGNLSIDEQNKKNKSNYYSEDDYYKNSFYQSATLSLNPMKPLNVQLGFVNLDINREKVFFDPKGKTTDDYDVKQRQIFFGFNYALSSKWSASASLNLFNYQSESLVYDTFDIVKLEHVYTPNKIDDQNFILSLGINHRYKNMNFGGSFSYSNIIDFKQYQAGLQFVWFPYGNLDLYAIYNIYGLFNNNENEMVSKLKLGYNLRKFLWIEVQGLYGNMQNFVDDNGYWVYNSIDETDLRTSLKLNFIINKRFSFFLSYINSRNLHTNGYIKNLGDEYQTTEENYYQQSILGGLTWKF